MRSEAPRVRYRTKPRRSDVAPLRRLVAATGVFHAEERAIAVELLEQRLKLGPSSGYFFFLAELEGKLVGYCTYGQVPLTRRTYDLYWIAVDPRCQGLGIGRRLLELAERAVARRRGRALYIETSSRDVYRRTRRFYREAGYRQAARFADFYAPGDHKIVFCKTLARR